MTNKSSEQDREIWATYTAKLAAVKKKRKSAPVKPNSDKSAVRKAAASEPLRLEKISTIDQLSDTALERKREKALRQGAIVIDAKMDMHGMTQVEAFEALAAFMRRAAKTAKRHLLIVTGKGPGGKGALRENFRGWLAQMPEGKHILAIRPASPKHGGEGAFYVVMKKV